MHLPAAPFTVHCVAQHLTSGGLQLPSAHWTLHIAPPQPTSLHASLPMQSTCVCAAIPRTGPHAWSPLHETSHVEAVPQSTPWQLCVPVQVTLQSTPGGHVMGPAHFGEPGHAITHVAPLQAPPAAGHAAAHAAAAASTSGGVAASSAGAASPPAVASVLGLLASASPASSRPPSLPSLSGVRLGVLTHATSTAPPPAAAARQRTDPRTIDRSILRLSHVVRARAGSSAVPLGAAHARSCAASRRVPRPSIG